MSILIRGMEMPKTCDDCTISCDHDAHIDGYRMVKPSRFCPLIELPEEHGDLIDRDELRKKKWTIAWDDGKAEYYNAEDIEAAPTVIPAEGRTE